MKRITINMDKVNLDKLEKLKNAPLCQVIIDDEDYEEYKDIEEKKTDIKKSINFSKDDIERVKKANCKSFGEGVRRLIRIGSRYCDPLYERKVKFKYANEMEKILKELGLDEEIAKKARKMMIKGEE